MRRIRQFLTGPRAAPYIFISPFYLLWAVFGAFPIFYSIWLSFHKRINIFQARFVGWSNFTEIFYRDATIKAFYNVFWYVIVNDIAQVTLGLFFAVLINAAFVRLKGVFRASYYIPNITSAVVTGILFSIFLERSGIINKVLGTQIPWLQSTLWAKPAVMMTVVWRWLGFWIVMFSAGLQNIPDDLYEAASIEGANGFQKFTYITFPLLRPVTLFAIVINTIGALQLFAEPLVLFQTGGVAGGGPLNSATTPVLEIYKAGFRDFEIGFAAALGWALAVLVIIATIAQMTLARRRGWTG